ncbi:MAG: DNA repair protein RadC [Nitrospiraceae bacterium]
MSQAFRLNERTGRYLPLRPLSAQDIITKAKELVSKALRQPGAALENPSAVMDYLRLSLGECEREIFAVVFLDTRHRVLATEHLFFGTIDACTVHPREVVKAALSHNAAAAILAHNHPSGLAEPSQADQAITRRVAEALKLVDIRLLDHFVVGDGEPVSFAERGLI